MTSGKNFGACYCPVERVERVEGEIRGRNKEGSVKECVLEGFNLPRLIETVCLHIISLNHIMAQKEHNALRS